MINLIVDDSANCCSNICQAITLLISLPVNREHLKYWSPRCISCSDEFHSYSSTCLCWSWWACTMCIWSNYVLACSPVLPEKSPLRPFRMRSARLSDRSRPRWLSCRCSRRHVSNWQQSELVSVSPLGSGSCELTHLSSPGAFDLLVYTDKDLVVPEKWEESGPQIIDQSEEVRLRSFTTSIHKVNSMVAYKRTDSV